MLTISGMQCMKCSLATNQQVFYVTSFHRQVLFACAYAAISIKVVHEQSGKLEYERERLPGTLKN